MSFLRTFQHLLPDGAAWRLTVQKRLREFFDGLSQEPKNIVTFVDDVYDDLHPDTTRELAAWETQFALAAVETDAVRRQALTAAWQATGGQSPRYLQDIIHAAGFDDVYIHEWWSSGPPYVARDPRSYTNQPLIGTVQCDEPLAECGEPSALCNAFLANEPGYLVNLNLTPIAPPAVPSDSAKWPFFVYFGGATFGTTAPVLETRRTEFEELLLRLCPTHLWIVTLVFFVDTRVTLAGDIRTTLAGDTRVTL